MKNLYIVDASGYIYRSYHAIPHMTNPKGESTNALFGFIRSIQKLRNDFQPEHLVAVFDGPKSIEKRKNLYSGYKAERVEMPQDLRYQIAWAQQVCELLGIPYLSVSGVEADDTIGSIAKWAAGKDAKAILCTSDKDMCQLVEDNKIIILNTFKNNLILNEKEVEEQFGVPPRLMIDFLAMTGDNSDNVPGIPGIGPKTASSLLQQFGSLDNILDHPELAGKKQELFKTYAADARMSRTLVTIDTEVPFPKDSHFFAIKPFALEPIKEFYTAMNFNSLLKELVQQQQQHQPSIDHVEEPKEIQASKSYQLINDLSQLNQLIDHLSQLSQQKQIAIRTLGSHPQPSKAELLGISFSTAPGQCWYLPIHGKIDPKLVVNALQSIFHNPELSFFGHNLKDDYLLLAKLGIHADHLCFDTMLASYILNSHHRQHDLDHLVLEYFGRVLPPFETILGKGKKAILMNEVLPELIYPLACEEVDEVFKLKSVLEEQLKIRQLSPLLNDLELPLLSVLAKMEQHGIYLDIPYLHQMSTEIQNVIRIAENQIYELAGETFNLNSPKQLSVILFEKLGIKAPKKTATGLSTSADVLENLQHPIAKLILEYRSLEKLRSTYIDALPLEVDRRTKRIHCTFNQSVAATGRLSCQNPNLQNIPIRTDLGRKIRKAFRPEADSWSFLAADYSQIELRLLAHLSEDPHLIEAFLQGQDVHAHTASLIFNTPLQVVTKEQRYAAKAVNFGVIYGQQAFGLSQALGIEIGEAAAFIEAYFKQYSRVKLFIEECKEKARQTGKAVTYTGRERLIPEINSKNGQIRALAERLAINTPLQGTAADLIKQAMLKIDQQLTEKNLKGYMILQIHDELIFEIPDEDKPLMEKLVKETMQNVLTLRVPLIVDVAVGKNWAEC